MQGWRAILFYFVQNKLETLHISLTLKLGEVMHTACLTGSRIQIFRDDVLLLLVADKILNVISIN